MHQLTNINQAILTMTSREIVELVDKQHSNIKISAERLAEKRVIGTLAVQEFDHNGNTYTEYLLSKRDSLILVAQNCPEFTARIVDRWQELEFKQTALAVPQSLSAALRLAADQADLIEQQQAQLACCRRDEDSMSIQHVVSVSGGKDSLATLLIAMQRFPRSDILPIFCDTCNEHELTYAYLDYLEARLGIKITRLKADFTGQIANKRKFISRDQRTRREYDTRPVFEADGITPVPKRDGRGQIVLNKKGQAVQKTVKVGGGRRVRWTNKGKRRALSVLHPSGNAFLDLCLWKGRFPSRKAQFCTEELKRNMAVEFQVELMDQGHTVVSWQGVRRDESHNRRNAKKFERVAPRLYIYRPIVDWTAMQTVQFATLHEILANPLYSMGMGRVGCFPCINAGKDELREMAARFPAHMGRISDWEQRVSMACKRGFSTFFHKGPGENGSANPRATFEAANIIQTIRWAKTTRGGKQFSLLNDLEDVSGCASSYGLCEQPSFYLGAA